MVTNVSKILKLIDAFAPFEHADSWDNVGLLIGNEDRVVDRILLTLDVTEKVIDEAIEEGIDLIIAHHPVIFSPLKAITNHDPIGAIALKCIENNIAIIAAHTNLDKVFVDGINYSLGKRLGLENMSILLPESDSHGYGVIGHFDMSLTTNEFVKKVKAAYDLEYVRGTKLDHPHEVKKVAISSGASIDFMDEAVKQGADAFITADLKYHECQHSPLLLLDIGHYESEFIYLETFKEVLDTRLGAKNYDVFVMVSEKSEGELFIY